ncbi:hypothetical protein GLOIN_2v1482909 [Rhizophagus clarus]|uniref:Uncharacterized protein n=1 Tax=Rhizophagus clarus TaxID=94130 RepID=A0A8H3QM28_9GLOM|nr:hypothetical protein GLOIN_2v1482909 [Rhizophagus clarus]
MASSLSVDSNPQVQKDGKRLKKINLVDEEWKALRRLTNILKKFAEATDFLGDTVFDEDVEYANSPKDEIDTRHPKGRKIYIEMSQDCKDLEKNVKNTLYKAMNHYWNVPNKYAMIGTLLDLRYKEL